MKALTEGKSSKCLLVLHVKCQHCRQSLLLFLENKLNSSARICPSDRFINLSKRLLFELLIEILGLSYLIDHRNIITQGIPSLSVSKISFIFLMTPTDSSNDQNICVELFKGTFTH